MDEIILTLSFLLSFLLTIYGTPVARKVAFKYNILDTPDGRLKKQKEPVPYMGGVIIYFAFISPVGLLFPFSRELLGILFAGSIVLIVGLFDDLKALTPGIKFLFQVVATYILVKSGIQTSLHFLPAWLNAVLSFLWILTVINAFNIIDIMDGLAPSVAMFSSLTIFIISIYNVNFIISILSLSLAASLMGFLKFNWQPAKIYLGDAGSMFIGLVLGALVIWGDYSKFNDLGFFSGLLILTVPLFDLVYVIILRIMKKKSPFLGSPDHFALRLKKKYNLSAEKTVSIIIIVQMFLSAIIILNFYTTETITFFTTLAVLLFFAIAGMVLARVKMD